MAVMDATNRAKAMAELMREISDVREPCAITKPDLLAAINAADDWVNSNSASFNSALPTAARNGLTTSQKARLLMFVVRQRFVVGA